MLGRVLRRHPDLTVRRVRWDTEDGDFLDLDIVEPDDPPLGSVIILHGLEGSSSRSYVRLTLAHLRALGLRGIALNFRSCGGESNRRARFYHSGDTGDLAAVVARLADAEPGLRRAAIGFSLGGNVLLKYLGETGTESGLVGAAAVSVPFDLAVSARLIGSGWAGRVYTEYFLRSLKHKLAAKAERADGGEAVPETLVRAGLAAKSLVAYDDAVTAPLHGFANAPAYYSASSSKPWIDAIRTPTVALHAADDPFLPRPYLPEASFLANPHTDLRITQRGGHLGFLEASGDASSIPGAKLGLGCWAERTAARVVWEFISPTSPGRR